MHRGFAGPEFRSADSAGIAARLFRNLTRTSPLALFISNIYNFIPNKYVIRGYDLVLDLLFRLSSDEINFNGSNFIETEHIENKFKYFKNKDSLGYRNLSTFIIKYENLELKVVD